MIKEKEIQTPGGYLVILESKDVEKEKEK